MEYTCALTELEFFAFHGLYPEEQVIGGHFVVDLLLKTTVADDAQMKELKSVLNYEALFNLVSRIMKEREDLIETVARKIMDEVIAAFSMVDSVEVSITKPNPAGLFKTGNAKITLKKTR